MSEAGKEGRWMDRRKAQGSPDGTAWSREGSPVWVGGMLFYTQTLSSSLSEGPPAAALNLSGRKAFCFCALSWFAEDACWWWGVPGASYDDDVDIIIIGNSNDSNDS